MTRPGLEHLETRLTPAVKITYNGAGNPLAITQTSPGNDDVTVRESSPGILQISLINGSFDPASSINGVNYFGPQFAQVDISTAGAITMLGIDLGSGSDTLRLGAIANTAGGIGSIGVSESGGGTLTTYLNSVTLPGGNLSVGGGPILMSAGTNISTNGGNITMTGRGSAAITSGIQVNGTQMNAGTGNITLAGTGFAGTNNAYGLYMSTNTQVKTTRAGAITLRGSGGAGVNANTGIVLNTGAQISTVDGNISLTGASYGRGNFNNGISVIVGSGVQSTGRGVVSFVGGAGRGYYNNCGIVVTDTNSFVRAVHGNLTLRGMGQSNGLSSSNFGVYVSDAAIVETTGAGILTLNGTGGYGVDQNFGVVLFRNSPQVRTAGAALNITGVGNGTRLDNYGIDIEVGVLVRALGNGKITIVGTGGNGTNTSAGIIVNSGSQIVSVNGDIYARGVGKGSGNNNFGFEILGGASLQALGTGKITLSGTSGYGNSFNHGIVVLGTRTQVKTNTGDIVMAGAGRGRGSNNLGVSIDTGGIVFAGGTGRVFMVSTASNVQIAAGSVVRTAGAYLSIQSGGGIYIAYGSYVGAPGAVTIFIQTDYGNPQPGVGTQANISAASLKSTKPISIIAGADYDILYMGIIGAGTPVQQSFGGGSGRFIFPGGLQIYFYNFEVANAA